jgi:DDE_Tnp_1-associated
VCGGILAVTLYAVICGADDWVAIARFDRAKRNSFREFLTLRRGTSELQPAPGEGSVQNGTAGLGVAALL